MANISDTIEKFILSSMQGSDSVEISRNALAEHFLCAPSQINYVLDTRFTLERGFAKETHRGSSGYIKIIRLTNSDNNAYLASLLCESVGEELSQKRMSQILDRLVNDQILTEKERQIVLIVLSDESLNMPFMIKDKVRASAFKNLLVDLMK